MFTRRSFIRILLSTLLLMAVTALTSCSNESGARKYDIDSRYYTADIYTIDERTDYTWIYKQNGKAVLITGHLSDDNTDCSYYRYELSDGTLSDRTLLDVDNASCFCGVGDDRTACYCEGAGFILFDHDGNRIRSEDRPASGLSPRHDIESAGDGFVVINSQEAVLYDREGVVKGQIVFDNIGFPSEEICYFEQEDRRILSVESQFATTAFYELDFDEGTYTFIADNTAFGLEDNDTVYRYGGFSYDQFNGLISKLSFDEIECVPVARIENLIMPPPLEKTSYNLYMYFLDEDTFATIYRYDTGKTDVILVSLDNDSSYEARTQLVIKGSGATLSPELVYSAYRFNTEQDTYLVKVEDFGDEYSYNNAIEAQQAKLQLITAFQNGDVPDMFYGNDFDYDYWGRSGMVRDMLPLIDQEVFEQLSEGIRELMISDGHCYKVFSGYTLFGYIGASSQYPEGSYSIYDLPPLEDGQRRICNTYAHDLADFMIRYSVMNDNTGSAMLDRENMEQIVRFSIENGIGPNDMADVTDGFLDSEDSLSLQFIANDIRNYLSINRETEDRVCFVGFPAIDGSIKAVNPTGLVAISSGTEYPQACAEFVSILLSDEVQRLNYNNGSIPVNGRILDEYIEYMMSPETIPADELTYLAMATTVRGQIDENGHLTEREVFIEVSPEDAAGYMTMVTDVNTLITLDWGIYNIICEEIDAYYTSGRSVEMITDSLCSRLELYIQENYG